MTEYDIFVPLNYNDGAQALPQRVSRDRTLVCAGLLTQQTAEVWRNAAVLLALGALLYGVNVLVMRRLNRGGAPGL